VLLSSLKSQSIILFHRLVVSDNGGNISSLWQCKVSALFVGFGISGIKGRGRAATRAVTPPTFIHLSARVLTVISRVSLIRSLPKTMPNSERLIVPFAEKATARPAPRWTIEINEDLTPIAREAPTHCWEASGADLEANRCMCLVDAPSLVGHCRVRAGGAHHRKRQTSDPPHLAMTPCHVSDREIRIHGNRHLP
jgi:hypothetical protein